MHTLRTVKSNRAYKVHAKGITWFVHCRVFNSCTYQTVIYFACLLPFAVVEVHTTHAAKVLTTTQVFATSTPHTHKHTCTDTHTDNLVAICCWHLPSNKQQTFMLLKNERRIEKILNTSLPYVQYQMTLTACLCVCVSVLYVFCMCG